MKCTHVPNGKSLYKSICTVFIVIVILPVVSFAATNSIRVPNPRFSAPRSLSQMSVGGPQGTNSSEASSLPGAVLSSPAVPSPLLRSGATATLGLNAGTPRAGQIAVTSPILNINFTCPTVEKTGMAAIGVSDSDAWNNYEALGLGWAVMPDLVWSDGTASGAGVIVQNGPGLWGLDCNDDPMYHTYLYPWDGGHILASITNLPAGTYDIYIYGHAPAEEANSIFELWVGNTSYGQKGTTIWGSGWCSTNWEEGQQYVVYRNVPIATDGPVIDVSPDCDGYAILNGIQVVPSGAISRAPPVLQQLLNLNFTTPGQERVGQAAVGISDSDVWNNFEHQGYDDAAMENLVWSTGLSSGAGIRVQNGAGFWGACTDDKMYWTYIYPGLNGDITITVTNLADGNYDFYLYGHGPVASGNSVFELFTGETSQGVKGTTIWGDAWCGTNWEEGQQYIVFRNVAVSSNSPVTIDVVPDEDGYAIINGLQIAVPLDRDNDGLPDWWELKNFGNLDQTATIDFDGDGVNNLQEYQSGTDPNKIVFWAGTTNLYVSTTSTAMQLNVSNGWPFYVAVLVDDTNFTHAVWNPYTPPDVPVNLGNTEGWHRILIGCQGLPAGGPTVWDYKRAKLDLTPPTLVITNPVTANIWPPVIQLQGYSTEDLSSISYDISNAMGVVTGQDVLILNRSYDTNAWEFTTNAFQAFDVPLTNGANIITIHATDLAGNSTNLTLTLNQDSSLKTNAPMATLTWPLDGMSICGTSFTVLGQVDDPTANVAATITDASNNSVSVTGLLERTGRFWIENVPLSAGANTLSVTITDIALHTFTTNITVVQSALTLTINPPTGDDLWRSPASVNGTITDSSYAVWVNGVPATNHGDGWWSCATVPNTPGGVAIFQVTAYPPGEAPSGNSFGGGSDNPQSPNAQNLISETDKPMRHYAESYWRCLSDSDEVNGWNSTCTGHYQCPENDNLAWQSDTGGTRNYSRSYAISSDCPDFIPAFSSYTWQGGWGVAGGGYVGTECEWSGDESETNCRSHSFATGPFDPPLEHCAIGKTVSLTWEDDFPRDPAHFDETMTYARGADTTYKLETGGKARCGHDGLFVLTAKAHALQLTNLYPSVVDVPAGPQFAEYDVAPENITILSQALGADSRLYTLLPDGISVDITPRVPGADYYYFDPNATKHVLKITADGLDTSAEYPPNTPAFIVGRSILFVGKWDVDPPSIAAPGGIGWDWKFAGDYYTDFQLRCAECSPDYRKDLAKLKTEAPAPWWVSGNFDPPASYPVQLKEKLRFENGQSVTMFAYGGIQMYRPDAKIDAKTSYVCVTNGSLGFGGRPYDPAGIVFSNTLSIPRNFSGNAKWVQVCYESDLTFEDSVTNYHTVQNGPGPFLDTHYPFSTFLPGTEIPFDTPNTELANPFIRHERTDSYTMYMMFEPTGGLPVPMRAVDWSWSGIATNGSSGWHLASDPSDHSTNPKDYPTQEYPVWNSNITSRHWEPVPPGL